MAGKEPAPTARAGCRWCASDNAEFDWYPAILRELLTGADENVRMAATCRGTGDRPVLRRVAHVLRHGAEPGDRVVDLGAGAGGPSAWLERFCRTLSIEALEPAHEAVRCARALFPGLRVRQGDILGPPADVLGDARAALLLGVLSTVPDRAGALRQARRVVRTGGRLVLTDFVRTGHTGRPLTLPGGTPAFTTRELLTDLHRTSWCLRSIAPDVRVSDPFWEQVRFRLARQIRHFVATTRHGVRNACPVALERESVNRHRFGELIERAVLERVFLVAEAV